MPEARHHHYIPQCYLRGFAVGAGKACKLTVANLDQKRFFETNPRNVAGVRDFMRINVPGMQPTALESTLADFEGKAATAIRNINQARKFEGEDRLIIINLIALLAVRYPQMRENIRKFGENILKNVMGLTLATKERWEGQLQQMKAAGHTVKEEVSYEDMVAFYKSGEYNINFDRGFHITLEMEGIDAILPPLIERKWELMVADESAGYFITTDRPVVLAWEDPEKMPPMMRHSPGFGMTNTKLLFPLTKSMCLLGSFEGQEGTLPADTDLIAVTNYRMIEFAFEQMYASSKAFPYLGPDLKTYYDRDFFGKWGRVKRGETE